MSKGKLEFELSDPDDRCEFERAVRANRAFDAIGSYDTYLRSEIKYGEYTEDQCVLLEKTRQEFRDILSTYGIDVGVD
jgi:hypothetical protein